MNDERWNNSQRNRVQRSTTAAVPYQLPIEDLSGGFQDFKIWTHHPEMFEPVTAGTGGYAYVERATGYVIFCTEDEIAEHMRKALESIDPKKTFTYSRKHGYECSTKGDRRFSAFCAVMPDGRTIEMWYQCGTLDGRGKMYDPGGTDWRSGKGKFPVTADPPSVVAEKLWADYYGFWDEWARAHPVWMQELRYLAARSGYTLRDSFAASNINQARALAEWLNNNPL